MNRPRLRGYAIGAVIGALFGAFWAESAASALPSAVGTAYDVTAILMVGAICIGAVRLLRSARRVPVSEGPEVVVSPRRVSKWLWWMWALVALAEVLVIGRVTKEIIAHELEQYLTAAIALIVGLHFFPMAWIFRAPEHLLAAIAMTAVAVVAVVAIAAGYDLGGAHRWRIVIGTVCAVALWSTCVLGLWQARTN